MGGKLTGDVCFRRSWWSGKIILQVEVETPDGRFFRDAKNEDMFRLASILDIDVEMS